jgi:phosphate starvation-inducible PhoH-like protein
MDILPGTEGVAFVRFGETDVVRHPVVARIINAYDQARGDRDSTPSGRGATGGRAPKPGR